MQIHCVGDGNNLNINQLNEQPILSTDDTHAPLNDNNIEPNGDDGNNVNINELNEQLINEINDINVHILSLI